MTAEQQRLEDDGEAWRRWGPYLSERAWGTVREDYSADGNAWDYFPHDHARSRAYRWNEDGLAGISDDKGRLCFALALWNGHDPILKERLFGLSNGEGNHGEDVKEYYYYLDSTPTHSWMQMLYKYPQAAFPYDQLVAENARRGTADDEFELIDTGVFDGQRYFDVFVEYAKAGPADLLIQIRVCNRGPAAAPIHVLPTLWFRNDWSWAESAERPRMWSDGATVLAEHRLLGTYRLVAEEADGWLWTENETNTEQLYNVANPSPYVKDAFHTAVVHGEPAAVNPLHTGTKVAAHYIRSIPAGDSVQLRLRLTRQVDGAPAAAEPFADFAGIVSQRQREADEFYAALQPSTLSADERLIHRQALGGMLWSKQFYHYIVKQWQSGDPTQPDPPAKRRHGRNWEWGHLYNERVMSMPDTWEYPWYAAWDLAFHCLPLALVDPDFAKSQLDLLTREWYQHPNGQLPAYEWNFSDVNPPVIAWAIWRIYKIEQKHYGRSDRMFLERVFHKLLLNFTWWVNRKDVEGNNVFQGGFLGLDNIGVFDRSATLPTGGHIEQSDGTSWMGMFSLNMMTIALELAQTNPVYEDIATKFLEHFLFIADAMNNLGGEGIALWDTDDAFFYDVLHLPDHRHVTLKVRSFVGLIPLFAVETIEPHVVEALPGFKARLEWFLANRPDLAQLVSRWFEPGLGERRLFALVRGSRMKRLLRRALDPNEFLSDYGIRALSKHHQDQPYVLQADSATYTVAYEPGESRTSVFGGNSNWRGPIWFPLNYLLIESLQKFHHYFGDDFQVECPTGSGRYLTIDQIADELSQRLINLFRRDGRGHRPAFGAHPIFQHDEHWRDYVLFYEYFHGDSGRGVGASHQTGWTGLVAKLIQQQGEARQHAGSSDLE
ncbi:MAG: glucosidase [Herpetosiphonaceae bacterium]|nr:glucosidase [Herpetosiphonaceae bacterium]